MFIKLGIIGTFLILGGLMFSTEISTLFPNTSASLLDSLKSDMNYLNDKVSGSAEERLDTSIDKIVGNVSDKVSEGITETGDKLVEEVNGTISEGITATGDNLKNGILQSYESSQEIITDEIFNLDLIKNMLN